MRNVQRLFAIIATSVFVLSISSTATATVIDFDGLADWDLVTNQFPDAVFTPDAGIELRARTINGAFGTSSPNALCAVATGTAVGNCANSAGAFSIDFLNPVNSLSFGFAANNITGVTIGMVDVFENSMLSATIDLIGAVFADFELVDLSAFTNVTGIRIHSITDPGGILYDDFTFEVARVPEPASLALMALGMAGIGYLRKRKTA